MEDIINHIHVFKIHEQETILIINRRNNYWTCGVLKGGTGAGSISGGKYETLQEFIKECEDHHRYCYYFYNYGHESAKQMMKQ